MAIDNRKKNAKSHVKNTGDFHPAYEDDKHQKPEPTAAIPAGAAAEQPPSTIDNSKAALEQLSEDDLRGRAKQLALPDYEKLDRPELISALEDYGETLPRHTISEADRRNVY